MTKNTKTLIDQQHALLQAQAKLTRQLKEDFCENAMNGDFAACRQAAGALNEFNQGAIFKGIIKTVDTAVKAPIPADRLFEITSALTDIYQGLNRDFRQPADLDVRASLASLATHTTKKLIKSPIQDPLNPASLPAKLDKLIWLGQYEGVGDCARRQAISEYLFSGQVPLQTIMNTLAKAPDIVDSDEIPYTKASQEYFRASWEKANMPS